MVPLQIILIEPGSSKPTRLTAREGQPEAPLGLLSLASYLKLHGYQVSLVDLSREDFSREGFKRHLRKLSARPLAVGISLYTELFDEGIEIAKMCRDVFPKTALVAGGVHVTFQPAQVLASAPIDFVVRREGESTFVELLEHLRHPDAYPLQLIKSISYRDQAGAVVSSPDRPVITGLDSLPFPDYGLLAAGGKLPARHLAISGSRGCPGECIYCASRAFAGRRYRFHSAAWLFSLLYEHRMRYRIASFALLDDTFTVDRKRARELCRLIRESWPGPVVPQWSCRSRADCVVDEICQEVARSGCDSIHIGVESADQEVLRRIGKRLNLEKMIQAIICGRKHGLNVECSFILGHHCDTRETIEKTVMLAKAIDTIGIGYSVVAISTPFPGTRLFEEASSLGIDISETRWSRYDLSTPIYSTASFSLNDIRHAYAAFKDPTASWSDPVGLTDLDHREFREQIQQLFAELGVDLPQGAAPKRHRLPAGMDQACRLEVCRDPVTMLFEDGTAALMLAEVPDWLRVSGEGAWIVDQLRQQPMTGSQVVAAICSRHGLPQQVVEEPTKELLAALINRGIVAGADGQPGPAASKPMPLLVEQPLEQVSLHLVSHCNLACSYCFGTLEHRGEMPLELAVQACAQASSLGVKQVTMTGGEPMLHSQALELLKACREASPTMQIKLISNGTAAHPDIYREAQDLVDELVFSLDGADEVTHDTIRGPGSYQKLLRTLTRIRPQNELGPTAISFTPHPANLQHIPGLLTTAMKVGASRVIVNQPRRPARWPADRAVPELGFLSQEEYRQSLRGFGELLRALTRTRKGERHPVAVDLSYALVWPLTAQLLARSCGGGVVTVSIDPSGTAYPCSALTGRAECALGRLPEQSLQELVGAGRQWNKEVFSVDRDDRCCSCVYRYHCGGGCRALGETLASRDARCLLMQEEYKSYLKRVVYTPHQKKVVATGKRIIRPREDHVPGFRCP